MQGQDKSSTLNLYLAYMDALENRLEDSLQFASGGLEQFENTSNIIKKFRNIVSDHRKALQGRRRIDTVEDQSLTRKSPFKADFIEDQGVAGLQLSDVFDKIYMLMSSAMFRYAILHAMSHRFFESTGEGNLADLAEKHLRDYAGAMQDINQLVSDIAVLELTSIGLDCQCECPSCGLGICLCAPHGITTINKISRETVPADPSGGVVVRPLRANSSAQNAGLHAKDTILEADDGKVNGWMDIQMAIRKHQPGEDIRFKVRRGVEEVLEIPVKIR